MDSLESRSDEAVVVLPLDLKMYMLKIVWLFTSLPLLVKLVKESESRFITLPRVKLLSETYRAQNFRKSICESTVQV